MEFKVDKYAISAVLEWACQLKSKQL